VTTQLVITEPVIDYSGRENEFANGSRETPLRSLRITTDALPQVGIPESGTAWIVKGSAPWETIHPQHTTADLVQFALCGTDWSGRDVHFSMPLFFIADDQLASAADVTAVTNASPPMVTAFHPQPITLTGDPAARAATTVTVSGMSFALQPLTGSTAAPFALVPDMFEVELKAFRPFAPALTTVSCRLHAAYTAGAGGTLRSAANPNGAFLQLINPVDAVLGAAQVGGVAIPNPRLAAVNVVKGLVPAGFDVGTGQVPDLQAAFGNTKILGAGLIGLLGDAARQEAPLMQHMSLPDRVTVDYAWKPVLKQADGLLRLGQDSVLSLFAHVEQRLDPGSAPTSTVNGSLTNFAVNVHGEIIITFARLGFSSTDGSLPAIAVDGCTVAFAGDLSFVNDVLDQIGGALFGAGFAIAVAPNGVTAAYTLALPAASFGAFGLTNVVLGAAVELPFDGSAPSVRFALSTRSTPFLVSVYIFGGGGYFVLVANAAQGIVSLEASIEIGGVFQFDLGVVSGGVHALVGLSFTLIGTKWTLGGFLRCGGYVDVLGIAGVSVEFEVMLRYSDPVVAGTAEVTAGVHVFGFTKSVSFSVTKSFTVHGSAPVAETFAAMPSLLAGNALPVGWDAYCEAFA
jgi:hypothetical protein